MMFLTNNERNEILFRMMYDDEILHQMYKYVTSLILLESEVTDFIKQLKKYEEVGLCFYLYYMDSLEREDERKVCGFSNFALRETPEGSFYDISHIGDESMHKYFNKIFQEDGYFIASDNFLKKDSQEEEIFNSLPERKEHTWKPVVIK